MRLFKFVKLLIRFCLRLYRYLKRFCTDLSQEIVRNRLFEAIFPGLRIGKGARIIGPKVFTHLFSNMMLSKEPKLIVHGNVNIGPNVLIFVEPTGTLEIFDRVYILDSCKIQVPHQARITINQGTTIERQCTISGLVSIGQECILAPRVFISTGTHSFDGPSQLSIREIDKLMESDFVHREISLEASVFVGVGSTILSGCVIGRRSVIGAGAIVVDSFPNGFEIIGGVPAKILRRVNS